MFNSRDNGRRRPFVKYWNTTEGGVKINSKKKNIIFFFEFVYFFCIFFYIIRRNSIL